VRLYEKVEEKEKESIGMVGGIPMRTSTSPTHDETMEGKESIERRKVSVCCMYSHDTHASNILPTNRTVKTLKFVATVWERRYRSVARKS